MLKFFEQFDFVNLDITALTGAACDKSVNFHVTFTAMSMCPVAVILFLIYSFCKGRIRTNLYIRKVMKDENSKEKALINCYKDLFAVVDTDRSGSIDAAELIDLLRLIGYQNTKEYVLDIHKSIQLIRMACQSKYATEITEVVFLTEVSSGRLLDHLSLVFSNNQVTRKKRKKKNTQSLLHDSSEVLAWNEKRKLVTTLLNIGMPILVLLHTPVSKKVFQFFDCDRIGSADWSKSFLRVDYSIPCSEGGIPLFSYLVFLPYVLLVLGTFTVALPLLLTQYLVYHQNSLYSPTVLLRLGWLYDRMQRGSEHWEIYEILRKMTLTGLIVFFPRNPIIRACMCVIVCAVATAGLNYHRPHKNYLVFWIDQICHIVALLIYVIAMVFASGLDEKSKTQVGDVFIAIFVVLFVIFVITIAVTVYTVHKTEYIETATFGTAARGRMAKEMALFEKHSGRNTLAGSVSRAVAQRTIAQKQKMAEIAKKTASEQTLSPTFDLEQIRTRRLSQVNLKSNMHALISTDSEMHRAVHAEIDSILDISRASKKDHDILMDDILFGGQQKEIEQEVVHFEFLKLESLLQRLDRQSKLLTITKKISKNGNVVIKRLKKLLKQLKCDDIDGLVTYMLKALSDDNGTTISQVNLYIFGKDSRFGESAGMNTEAVSERKEAVPEHKEAVPEHKEFQVVKTCLQRLDRQSKLLTITKKISKNGRVVTKRLKKLLKHLKCDDIDGLVRYMLQTLSDDNGTTISQAKFQSLGGE